MNQKQPFEGESPKVTGLSPKEGPPGTLITIRGENLGESEDDLIGVSICDVDCLIWSEWKSSSKIIARSGIAYGLGDVIVFTKSGGIGTCTVQFKSIKDIISPIKESSVWVNEDEYFSYINNIHRNSVSPSHFLMHEEDPLGIKLDDNQPTRSKLKDSVFHDFFPEIQADENESTFSDFCSNNFLPAWYLLENYNFITFGDLKSSHQHLKEKNDNSKSIKPEDESIKLLKPNVLPVIECLDSLKAVHFAFKKDKQELGELTIRLEDSIKKATIEAHEIFDQILARKDAVDSTRNALNVLQRYRFLFNLPSSIEGNIQKQDYEQVITDYLRAKSLFSDTQVKVFQRVYKEVENKIEKFKITLKDRLIDTCKERKSRNLDEIKRLIKHLVNLDVPGNPGWASVNTIKDTLFISMNECKEKYVKIFNKPEIMEPSDESRSSSSANYATNEDSPQSVQFIDELIEVFKNSFLDLVTLGNYYLNNELYSKDSKEQLKAKELEFTNEFIQKPIDLLVLLIRDTLLPDTSLSTSNANGKNQSYDKSIILKNSEINANFVRWLPHCLLITTNLYNELSLLELPGLSMLQYLQQLIFDLRVHSLSCVFKHSAEEVKQMYSKENWDINFDDNGTRTQLPLLFESKVEEILRLVRETILQVSTPDEVDIFTKFNVQGQMKQLAQNLLASFVNTLDKTSNSQNLASPTTVLKSNPTSEARLLIVICNCQYTSNQVIPRLQENFDKYNYPDMGGVIKLVQTKFKELENRLFSCYIERSKKILEPIRLSMQIENVEWYKRTSKPIAVSYYIKELVMSIIEIQADVFVIAPHLVKKIVIRLIDLTIEEISKLFDSFCVNELNKNSNLQALLDLTALKFIFDDPDNFKSLNSAKLLDRCFNHLHTLHDNESEQLLDQLMNQFKNSMGLQLQSLKWRVEQVVIAL